MQDCIDGIWSRKTALQRSVDKNQSSIVYYLVKHCGQGISTIDQVHV